MTTTPSPPDWRGLCQRMAAELDHYRQLLTDDRREAHPLAVEARAALAQPEPEVGPTTMEIIELAEEIEAAELGEVDLVRAALARWGRPAPAPPVEGEVLAGVNWLRQYTNEEFGPASNHSDARQLRRAADLLEQRQAAPVPVALSERPWEREGWCHPEERWAWFYNRRVGWRDAIPPESLKPPTLFPYTHSLPFNALPLPSLEVAA